jgi:hypothetical protein
LQNPNADAGAFFGTKVAEGEIGKRNADMEQLLEFLERRPEWLRSLVWDAIITFLRDDEGLDDQGD